MGIKVSSQDDMNFGIASARLVITHMRFRRGRDDAQPVVIQLGTPVVIEATKGMTIRTARFSIKYLAGKLGNAHIREMVRLYWQERPSNAGTIMEVDLLTAADTVVADSGYGQQSYSNWLIEEEAD